MGVFDCRGVELDGIRTGDGPPLLMLHGAGGPGSLGPAIAKLADQFEVLAPHHPGFGGSPTVDEISSVDDLSYLYLDLLDELDLSGVTLMGFSMGGWTACEIAVKSTARVARLILVDPVGIRVDGRPDCEIADIFNVHPSKMPELVFHDPSLAVLPADMNEEQQLLAEQAKVAAVRYTWEPYMHNPKLRGRLHRIDVPTLLIWGASDGIVMVAYGEEYTSSIPGARMVVIDKAGHQPHLEQTDRFVSEVLTFAQPALAAE